MPDKTFLEDYPLLKKFDIARGYFEQDFQSLPKPAINMHCAVCKSIQTYNMENEYGENSIEGDKTTIWNSTVRAVYRCSACFKSEYLFFIEFIRTDVGKNKQGNSYIVGYMRKVGQNPPWSIKMEKNLEKMLGEHADFYKKGLVCESQGYGIGAYAYYRRIVETIIDQLLDLIPELLEAEQQQQYKEALKKTKEATRAKDKIAIVKDMLPSSLIAEGYNPLGIIYKSLSEGIHALSDDDCLVQAELIRTSLNFLVDEILRKKQNLKVYTDSIKKLAS
jgi:tetratricopeptide (TPR) repeat protein